MRHTVLAIGLTALTVAGLARPRASLWPAASELVAPTLNAQSLADVARKEEERRKAVKTPAKVITNEDLGPAPATTPAPATEASPASKPAGDAKDAAKAPGDSKDAPKDGAKDAAKDKEPVKDQAYWSGRQKALQTALERDNTFLTAMQSHVNGLTTDFANRDDPAQRAVVERDRQKALADLAQLQKAIVDDKKALADLDEEARRAGVPPGWLR